MSQPQDGAGTAAVEGPAGALHVDFAGELFDVGVDDTLTIGRRGSIALDDNPYMHRDFLRVSHAESARLHDERAMAVPFKGEGVLVAFSGLEELKTGT